MLGKAGEGAPPEGHVSREAKGGTRKPRQDTAQRELSKPVLC